MQLLRLLVAFPAVVILSGCQATEDFRARAVRRIQSAAICSLVQIPAVSEGSTRSTSTEPLRLNRRKPGKPPASRIERPPAVAASRPSPYPARKGTDDPEWIRQQASKDVALEDAVVAIAGRRVDHAVQRSSVIFERRLPTVRSVPVVTAITMLREPLPVASPVGETPCAFGVVPEPLHFSATVLPRPAAGIATGGGSLCPSPESGPCARTAIR